MTLKVIPPVTPTRAFSAVSGVAMDRPSPKRSPPYAASAIGIVLLLAGIVTLSRWVPHGLRVVESEIRIANATQGMFHNDVVVRAMAEPLHTIMLDAFESGRVEEVMANDGSLVAKDALLFRLSNPQLSLNLVAREADRAQQISNLSNLRVSIETSATEHQRRMLDLKFALAQAEKQHARNAVLAKTGVVAAVALEESADRLAHQIQALEDETTRADIEVRIKRDGIRQLQQAIAQLDVGLEVVNESIEALAVRAPIAGRLTDFRLQLGQIVKSEERVGRIDDPTHFKLTAQLDEYFLGSVLTGKRGTVDISGQDYAVEVSRVFPQITDGRFSIELKFTDNEPSEMSPGQSAETRIALGRASSGLVLPNDAFLNDTGGTWIYVLSADGQSAERRTIRIERRSNSQVEVAEGLAPGERVIVSSYAAFGSAARLQLVR